VSLDIFRRSRLLRLVTQSFACLYNIRLKTAGKISFLFLGAQCRDSALRFYLKNLQRELLDKHLLTFSQYFSYLSNFLFLCQLSTWQKPNYCRTFWQTAAACCFITLKAQLQL